MDEDGCGSSRVWNICSGISLDNVVISVYYWDLLQVGLCNRVKCCYAGMERENCWRWILRTSSIQCHIKPFLVPLRKPPDPVKDFYDGQYYDLKTRVDT